MTDNPTKPTVQEADVAALIERVRRQHWHKSHWRNDQRTEMCGCGGPWPCDVLSLASALERAQADTARLDWLDTRRYEERNPYGKEDDPPAYCSWGVQAESWDVRAAIDDAMSQTSSAT